jgi:hypothetical protein
MTIIVLHSAQSRHSTGDTMETIHSVISGNIRGLLLIVAMLPVLAAVVTPIIEELVIGRRERREREVSQ